MDETKAPWVLVTGASGGIGLELARCFARAGHPVVVSARSEEKLAQVAAELVRAHGGSIMLVDTDRPGATFAIVIPDRPSANGRNGH